MTTIMTCFVGGKRARLVSGAGGGILLVCASRGDYIWRKRRCLRAMAAAGVKNGWKCRHAHEYMGKERKGKFGMLGNSRILRSLSFRVFGLCS
jgi:hypothetical protein